MRTDICDQLGIEFPIFAFSHCRDVVAAVTKAGGLGVLGAVGFSPEDLEIELKWLDENVGDRPYGVDIVIPSKYEGMGIDDMTPEELEAEMAKHIPQGHRDFGKQDPGRPRRPRAARGREAPRAARAGRRSPPHPRSRRSCATTRPSSSPTRSAPRRPTSSSRCRRRAASSAPCAARSSHALRHKDAGLDFVVCQGTEGGGHCGEIASMVLWPQVIDAISPMPMLAAGGIGNGRQVASALAMGAQGAWTGSLWLTVEEADVPPAQMQTYVEATSHDTVRSRSFTGKPCRMLRNDWTEAWEGEGSPGPLPMPLQMMVALDAVQRGHRYPEAAKDVNFNPVGQVVGQMNRVERTADVVQRLVDEYLDACERLNALNARALA